MKNILDNLDALKSKQTNIPANFTIKQLQIQNRLDLCFTEFLNYEEPSFRNWTVICIKISEPRSQGTVEDVYCAAICI